MAFENLNDDCQLRILSYLSLQDQMKLWKATKNTSYRLHENIIYVWQREVKYNLNTDLFDDSQLWDGFISVICSTVQHLELQFVDMDFLTYLQPYRFPNMKSLEYFTENLTIAEDVINRLAGLFPNLDSLKPEAPLHVVYHENWKNLRKLNLSECWFDFNFRDSSVHSICKYDKLEELIIDCYKIDIEVVDVLISLPNLNNICFQSNTKDAFMKIIDVHGENIQKVSFEDQIWAHDLSTLKRLKNLHHLTLIEDDGFQATQLNELISELPVLENLEILDTQFWRHENELWQMISSSPSLRILNISGMQLYEDFFASSRRFMNSILDNRSTPLTLHCYNTGLHENLIHKNFQHPKLNLSFVPHAVKFNELNTRVEIYRQ